MNSKRVVPAVALVDLIPGDAPDHADIRVQCLFKLKAFMRCRIFAFVADAAGEQRQAQMLRIGRREEIRIGKGTRR